MTCFLVDQARDIRQLDSAQAAEYGKKLQDESSTSLDRSLASIDDSMKVDMFYRVSLMHVDHRN